MAAYIYNYSIPAENIVHICCSKDIRHMDNIIPRFIGNSVLYYKLQTILYTSTVFSIN